nr:apomucin-like [Paramormyrops kingsleyae]
MMLEDKNSTTCVNTCPHQCCNGPLGEPKQPGDTWVSECHSCTCSNTMTVKCEPLPPPPPVTCTDAQMAITSSQGCWNTTICVHRCQQNGKVYQVGQSWNDPNDPCVTYVCEKEGLKTVMMVCQGATCAEEFRIWDAQHCCYNCSTNCSVTTSPTVLSYGGCTGTVQIPTCQGQCQSSSMWSYSNGVFQMGGTCSCCQEKSSEQRQVQLTCSDKATKTYTYRHITACECSVCKGANGPALFQTPSVTMEI